MKKLSIYWKTVLVSLAIILSTILTLVIVLSFFTPKLTQQIQEERFNEQVKKIQSVVSRSGTDIDQLKKLTDDNLRFELYKNDELLYDSWAVDVKYNPEKLTEEEIQQSHVVPVLTNGALLEANREVTFQKQVFKLYIAKTITFTAEESTLLLKKTLPLVVVIGVFSALLLSLLYARFFSNKISQLSLVMEKMKTKSYPADRKEVAGDELQELENDINKLYTQLLSEIKIVSKFEEERQLFLRGVTHELKTPIMTMGVTLEGILAGVEGYENYQDSLAECYQELQSMAELVNEILDLAKIQSIKDVGSVDVSTSLKRILGAYQYSFIEKNIQVIEAVDGEMKLNISENHFDKVLSNLISNVTKYSPSNEALYIELTPASVRISNKIHKNAAIDVNKIFDAFVTTSKGSSTEIYKSHGLGLYIVSSILAQYHIEYRCWINEGYFNFQIYTQGLSDIPN